MTELRELLGAIMAEVTRPEIAWMDLALCAEVGPTDLFFPEKGGTVREAKRMCMACEVRAECLEYALAHDERFGIWGGMSEKGRQHERAVRRQRAGQERAA